MKIGYLMQAGVPDVRHYPLSGPAMHVKCVFSELRDLGHRVRLLALLDGQIWKSDDLQYFERVPLRWLNQPLTKLFESAVRRVQYELRLPYFAFFESFRTAMACRQELTKSDLIYERMGWMGYGGGIASRWLGIPLVLEVNGDHLDEMKMLGMAPVGLQRRLSIAIMNKAVQQASHVVATGDGWRRRFIERWGVNPAKVSVVENGSSIVNLLTREQLRCFLPEQDRERPVTIVYLGAFEPWHGISILIHAVSNVFSQGISLRLLLIGSGSEWGKVQRLIHEFSLERVVTLIGQVELSRLADYLVRSDIGVAPYCGRVEYSGLKLLDYKSAGLATIASGENGRPAVLEQGRTGLIVPPCDEESLTQAIICLLNDANLRKQMGRTARIEAEQFHSWCHTAGQLERIFTKVLESHPLDDLDQDRTTWQNCN
jgi:glycosyltransferase involved in cell wall biosynthesis